MSNTPHALSEEFPEHARLMAELKERDAYFARLYDEYHQLDRTIHRAETLVEPMAELQETELRKQRVVLKDLLYKALGEADRAQDA